VQKLAARKSGAVVHSDPPGVWPFSGSAGKMMSEHERGSRFAQRMPEPPMALVSPRRMGPSCSGCSGEPKAVPFLHAGGFVRTSRSPTTRSERTAIHGENDAPISEVPVRGRGDRSFYCTGGMTCS
jgi:hypothetical protein